MIRCAAVLSLLLAGPALAAPPLGAASDNAAIHDEINAADPTITTPPAPLERLVAAAELAEARLEAATEPRDVADLLELTATARKVAHQRTGAAIHLCQLLTAAEGVTARDDLPPRLKAEADAFANDARTGLAAHTDAPCMQPESEPTRAEPTLTPISRPEPIVTPTTSPLPRSNVRPARGLIAGGGVSLALAGFAGVGLIAVRAYRIGPYQEHAELVVAAELAGGKTLEQEAQLRRFTEIKDATSRATIGLAVSGAALAVLGAALVAAGKKRPASTRAHVVPFGGPQGAGVGLSGRF